MKTLKAAIIVLALFSISIYGQNIKVGGGLAYGTDISTVGIYGGGLYQFTEKIEGAGFFTYFLEKDNLSWSAFDFDAHYIFSSENGMEIYGLGGINITLWSFSFETEAYEGFGGYSIPQSTFESSGSEIGLNIGGGVRKNINANIDLMGDVKYTLGGANYLNIKVGVLYSL